MTANTLPVVGPDKSILYYAPIGSVQRLIDSGRVRPLGNRAVRALIAMCDSEELMALLKPVSGTRYSHNHETGDNPRGVWTFRRMYAT